MAPSSSSSDLNEDADDEEGFFRNTLARDGMQERLMAS